MDLQIQTIESLPFYENTYIVWRAQECVVIDPGLEPELIMDFLEQRQLRPVAILNTHGHADHIAGNQTLKAAFPAIPLVIGVGDAPLLRDPELNVSRMFGFDLISPPADQLVRAGEQWLFAGITFDIYEVPGHSPGHVAYYVRDAGVVFAGDVLMRGGFGRTDFPGGSFAQLVQSITTKLFTLPDATVVYPGHGPVTRIDHERQTNPILNMK
jgi:glyoxylase-like metal-dependent hydrolase (beta-lactamase superfamily II)